MNKYYVRTVDGQLFTMISENSLEDIGSVWDDKKIYLIDIFLGNNDDGSKKTRKTLFSFKHIVEISEIK